MDLGHPETIAVESHEQGPRWYKSLFPYGYTSPPLALTIFPPPLLQWSMSPALVKFNIEEINNV